MLGSYLEFIRNVHFSTEKVGTCYNFRCHLGQGTQVSWGDIQKKGKLFQTNGWSATQYNAPHQILLGLYQPAMLKDPISSEKGTHMQM